MLYDEPSEKKNIRLLVNILFVSFAEWNRSEVRNNILHSPMSVIVKCLKLLQRNGYICMYFAINVLVGPVHTGSISLAFSLMLVYGTFYNKISDDYFLPFTFTHIFLWSADIPRCCHIFLFAWNLTDISSNHSESFCHSCLTYFFLKFYSTLFVSIFVRSFRLPKPYSCFVFNLTRCRGMCTYSRLLARASYTPYYMYLYGNAVRCTRRAEVWE